MNKRNKDEYTSIEKYKYLQLWFIHIDIIYKPLWTHY